MGNDIAQAEISLCLVSSNIDMTVRTVGGPGNPGRGTLVRNVAVTAPNQSQLR